MLHYSHIPFSKLNFQPVFYDFGWGRNSLVDYGAAVERKKILGLPPASFSQKCASRIEGLQKNLFCSAWDKSSRKKQGWKINWFKIKTPCLLLILQELDGISGRLLRWLVDGADDGPDAERHVRKNFVSAVKKSEPLPSGRAPEQQEVVDDVGVLEHNVVDVSVSLKSWQSHS